MLSHRDPFDCKLIRKRYGDVPIATLNVGKPATVFRIHKNLLCDESPVFRAAFLGTFIESEGQSMELEEEDADVFEVITRFIYTQTCVLGEEAIPNDKLYMYRLATYRQ